MKTVLYPLNDNEKKGLPADIDLLETAIQNLKVDKKDQRRLKNFHDIHIRVFEQIRQKLLGLEIETDIEPPVEFSLFDSLNKAIQDLKTDPHNINFLYRLHQEMILWRN